jgi:hypothetical protein
MASKHFHCHIEISRFLAKRRRLDGLFASDGRDLTNKEARAMLKAWPYPNFCGCDNPTADGKCGGHDKP